MSKTPSSDEFEILINLEIGDRVYYKRGSIFTGSEPDNDDWKAEEMESGYEYVCEDGATSEVKPHEIARHKALEKRIRENAKKMYHKIRNRQDILDARDRRFTKVRKATMLAYDRDLLYLSEGGLYSSILIGSNIKIILSAYKELFEEDINRSTLRSDLERLRADFKREGITKIDEHMLHRKYIEGSLDYGFWDEDNPSTRFYMAIFRMIKEKDPHLYCDNGY